MGGASRPPFGGTGFDNYDTVYDKLGTVYDKFGLFEGLPGYTVFEHPWVC